MWEVVKEIVVTFLTSEGRIRDARLTGREREERGERKWKERRNKKRGSERGRHREDTNIMNEEERKKERGRIINEGRER